MKYLCLASLDKTDNEQEVFVNMFEFVIYIKEILGRFLVFAKFGSLIGMIKVKCNAGKYSVPALEANIYGVAVCNFLPLESMKSKADRGYRRLLVNIICFVCGVILQRHTSGPPV